MTSYQVLKQYEEFDREFKLVTDETREVKWVYGKGALKFDENKNSIEMFGTIQDNTKCKLVEEDYLKVKSVIRILFRNYQKGIIGLN